ncbi:hypothetical protein DACRYDRAFT_60338 [Dacryopinax primogenitus]|uniref:Uncharacterized protein n=1 Tax=Dacryopinax primogenitus (strain DJM 731) TaxID=1858805 RepID=M5FMZ5_DACPD|nr:uncharacterized protein DACRYDRAFT_60338 [Dacryopinax primogenitus]EJT96555.1 hypothetical protein DACRYDRAFT_60338 [Dacryopinax primogenitus]
MVAVPVSSPKIRAATLHCRIPLYLHLYASPFVILWSIFGYAYVIKYEKWFAAQERAFIAGSIVLACHLFIFLITQCSAGVNTRLTCVNASSLDQADCIRIVPTEDRGKDMTIPLRKTLTSPITYTFVYQSETYICTAGKPFTQLLYPCDSRPLLSSFTAIGLSSSNLPALRESYCPNTFDIPMPSFGEIFAEHGVASFFIFQMLCIGLWSLDECWHHSLLTAFLLSVFECTVMFQRVDTLKECRIMPIAPFLILCYRDKKWRTVDTDELVPGDIVSITRSKEDTAVPADLLLLHGSVIMNEALLSGDATPLLKESIKRCNGSEKLDINGAHSDSVLYGGTRVLQVRPGEVTAEDGGCIAEVLRTGFGTTQGQLIRRMLSTTEGASAHNLESWLFIEFLLIFAIAALWDVWVPGRQRGMSTYERLSDCILIIATVVLPRFPKELLLVVNWSLITLYKYG